MRQAFEEWWEQEERVYSNESRTFKMVALEAWNSQQERIEHLEAVIKDYVDVIRTLQLTIADLQSYPEEPMEENALFERIEELERQVEWHKRRADSWRTLAILEGE